MNAAKITFVLFWCVGIGACVYGVHEFRPWLGWVCGGAALAIFSSGALRELMKK